MKKGILRIVLLAIAGGVIGTVLTFGTIHAGLTWYTNTRKYVTNDIADYGNYTGNYNNRFANEFITSFFPEKIEDNFEDVSYSYRALKVDEYAFEAVLEFTIEDPQEYRAFIEEYTEGMEASAFSYDDTFVEFVVSDEFRSDYIGDRSDPEKLPEVMEIRRAKIGKILCSDQEQRIIFVALGVRDGGVVGTDYLCVYFDRFQINPWEYATYYDEKPGA